MTWQRVTHDGRRGLTGNRYRRYERASTLLTSNRPVDDWGKLLGDSAALRLCSIASSITAMYSMRSTELAHKTDLPPQEAAE